MVADTGAASEPGLRALEVKQVARSIAEKVPQLKKDLAASGMAIPPSIVQLRIGNEDRRQCAHQPVRTKVEDASVVRQDAADISNGIFVMSTNLIAATATRFLLAPDRLDMQHTVSLNPEHVTAPALKFLAAVIDASPIADPCAVELRLTDVADTIRAAQHLNFGALLACLDDNIDGFVDASNCMAVLKAACAAGLRRSVHVSIAQLLADSDSLTAPQLFEAVKLLVGLNDGADTVLKLVAANDTAISMLLQQQRMAKLHALLGCAAFQKFGTVVCQHFIDMQAFHKVIAWDAAQCNTCELAVMRQENELQRQLLVQTCGQLDGMSNTVFLVKEQAWRYIWKIPEVSRLAVNAPKYSQQFVTCGVSSQHIDSAAYTWQLQVERNDTEMDFVGLFLSFIAGPAGAEHVNASYQMCIMDDHNPNKPRPKCVPHVVEDEMLDLNSARDDEFGFIGPPKFAKIAGDDALALHDDTMTVCVLITQIAPVNSDTAFTLRTPADGDSTQQALQPSSSAARKRRRKRS